MKKIMLGKTGIEVTELCFGALPMGPLQKNMAPEDSSALVAQALELGVNFVDTAMMYRTYEPIRLAMEKTGIRPVISNKSHVSSYDEMEKSVLDALDSLCVDYIDIFLMHAARVAPSVFEDRIGAYRCLLDYREKGKLKAIGISTHAVDVVHMAAENRELDIVFPILNKTGIGILRGKLPDMEQAIEHCFAENKGVYLMKALGGGNLIGDYSGAMEYVRNFSKGRAPIVLGMLDVREVEMNVRYFNGEDIDEELSSLKAPKKIMHVFSAICKGCGRCADACHSSVITINDGKAFINEAECLKCGYCCGDCPEFAIRMI